MSRELVLSFAVSPEDIVRLPGLRVLREGIRGRTSTRRVKETFYDSAGGRLNAAGVSLCIRVFGRTRIQSVARNIGYLAGAIERRRKECAIPTPDPVLGVIGDDVPEKVVAETAKAGLIPVFCLESRRTQRCLELPGGTRITLVLDDAEIVVENRRVSIFRADLCLTEGDPIRLFELARRVHDAAPLRPLSETWANRGRILLSGRPPEWFKKAPFDLSRKSTLEQSLISILRHTLAHMVANRACVLESDHPEGIHQMRIALRRTRSALRLFRKFLPPSQFAWIDGEAKWLANQLGPARDMDVFEDEIAAPPAAHLPDEPAFDGFLHVVRRQRVRCRQAARRAVLSERYATFLFDAGAWLSGRAWRDGWENGTPKALDTPFADIAPPLLSKRHRRVCRDGRLFDSLPAEDRHALRIDVKKLRYTLDFFESLYPANRVKPYLESLSRLQDGLGYLNDVTVARQLTESLCRKATHDNLLCCRYAGGIVIGWHAQALASLEDRLSGDVADFIRIKQFWKA